MGAGCGWAFDAEKNIYLTKVSVYMSILTLATLHAD